MGQPRVKKPNGALKFLSSRVAMEAARNAEKANRGWKQVAIGEFTPSVDISAPPAYILDVQGQRSDDVVFTVRIALDKKKIDMIPSAQATMRVVRDAIQNALNQLQTFKDCTCTLDTSCQEHQKQ